MINKAQYIKAKKIVEQYEDQLNVKYSKDAKLCDVIFNYRAYNSLISNGFRGSSTLEDVSKLSKHDLLNFVNVGVKTIDIVEDILKRAGLKLK
jgi:DNA-directed RNA polymerase alpha subunit